MADFESNLVALGVDINDPDQVVAVFMDGKRDINRLDQMMVTLLLLAVPTFLCLLQLQSDGAITQGLDTMSLIAGALIVIAFAQFIVGYVERRTAFSTQHEDPMLKIESEGITFRLGPFRFNRMPWNELEEVSVGPTSKITGAGFLRVSPVNPNTLYKLAVDETTKESLARYKAGMERLDKTPSVLPGSHLLKNYLKNYRDLSPICISDSWLPSPLTLADLALLINRRRALGLDSTRKIAPSERAQELVPVEQRPSVIEIKPKIKLPVENK
jgi:hypothetical protein